jgi:hypothetical protein
MKYQFMMSEGYPNFQNTENFAKRTYLFARRLACEFQILFDGGGGTC